METTEYNKIKKEILNSPILYRELEAKEIIALGEDHYQVGNTSFQVDPEVAGKIDEFAGIKAGQTSLAYNSYGDQGVTNLRNFFGQANKEREGQLVLTANKQSKQVIDAIPVKESLIPPNSFFNFAEMFMDKNRYFPDKIEYLQGSFNSVAIIMKPETERFMEYAKGDEFLYNGLFFLWKPGEVTLGNYYIRLVCTNGSTQLSRNSISHVHSLSYENIQKLLDLEAEAGPFKQNLEKMLSSARKAMKTKASVNELGHAIRLLKQQGLKEDEANEIIPYRETKEQYENAGYHLNTKQMALAKSDKTMWEVFNILTAFATHNTIRTAHDIKRSSLMESSMNLLLKERDIKDYYSIY